MAWADSEGGLHDGDPPEGFVELDGRHYPAKHPRVAESTPEPSEDAAALNPAPWYRQPKQIAWIGVAFLFAIWGLFRSQKPSDIDQADQFRQQMSEHNIDVSRVPTTEVRAAGVVVCDIADRALSADTFMIQVLSSDVLDTFDLDPSTGLGVSDAETIAMAELVNVYCRGALDGVLD